MNSLFGTLTLRRLMMSCIAVVAIFLAACSSSHGSHTDASMEPGATSPAPTSSGTHGDTHGDAHGDMHSGTTPDQKQGAPDVPAGADYNQADIEFVQGMIPHHQQAIEMGYLAQANAASDAVRKLATAIDLAQDAEVSQMRNWLEQRGQSEDAGDSGHDMHAMHGMLSPAQMNALELAKGEAFDRMFLEMMIAHHEGALSMAQTVLRDGQNPDVRALAEAVVATQRAEISQMQSMLAVP